MTHMRPRSALAGTLAALMTATPARAATPPDAALPGEPWTPIPADTAAPAPASPSPPQYDTVILRDGTVLRGTILELLPGRSVTFEAPTGGKRVYDAAEVAYTVFAGGPPPPPCMFSGTCLSGNVTTSAPVQPEPGRPRVFIETTRPAEVHLFEIAGAIRSGYGRSGVLVRRSVCVAPCGQVIDASEGNMYQFGGDRVTPSRALYLNAYSGDVVARVRPGRQGLLVAGLPLATFGFGATLPGALLTGIGRDGVQRTGAIILGVGAVLLTAGIALIARGITRVRLRPR